MTERVEYVEVKNVVPKNFKEHEKMNHLKSVYHEDMFNAKIGQKFKLEKNVVFEKNYELHTDENTVSWQSSYDYAAARGGRLLTHKEAKAIVQKEGSLGQGDQWIAIGDKEDRDWMQIGNAHYHYPGKMHNREYGYPGWGDSDEKQTWRKYQLFYKKPKGFTRNECREFL